MAKYEIIDKRGVYSTVEAPNHVAAVKSVVQKIYPNMTILEASFGTQPDYIIRGERSTKYYVLRKKEAKGVKLDVPHLFKLDRMIARKYIDEADMKHEPQATLTGITMWLKADVECALKYGNAKMNGINKCFKECIGMTAEQFDALPKDKKGYFDLKEIHQSIYIRSHFKEALDTVEYGRELSQPLGWGFAPEELKNLAILHKDGTPEMKEKIEDLLTDCNFHTECSAFISGKYGDL